MGDVNFGAVSGEKVVVANTIGRIDIRASLQRAAAGVAVQADVEAIDQALITGDVCAPLAVAAGVIETLQYVTEIYSGAGAQSVAAVLQQRQAIIDADRHKAEQKAYFDALRGFAVRGPYRLKGWSANLGETYVPLAFSTADGGLDTAGLAANGGLDLAQAVGAEGHVALIARAGAGKSAVLRHIALNAWAAPETLGLARAHIPMFIRLRHLAAAPGATIEGRFWRALESARDLAIGGATIAPGFMRHWSEQFYAPWLLLFDGLDEVPAKARPDLLDWMADAVKGLPGCRAVIASRSEAILAGSSMGQATRKIYIEALSCDHRRELVSRLTDPSAAEALEQAIESSGSEDVLDTPLHTSIAALVFREAGQLPRTRTRLFETFVGLTLDEADRQGLDEALPATARGLTRQLLETIALAITEDDGCRNPASLIDVVAGRLGELRPGTPKVDLDHDAGRAIGVLVDRCGLMAPGDDVEWTHETMREFLAAAALARERLPLAHETLAYVDRWNDLRWRNVVLFMVGRWAIQAAKPGPKKIDPASLDAVLRRLMGLAGDMPKSAGLLGRLGLGAKPAEAQTPARENLLIAAEAMAEAETASPSVQQTLFSGLCGTPSTTTFNICEGLFTSDRRELDVLLRFRSWPGIDKSVAPFLLPVAKQLFAADNEARAAGAAMLLVRLGAKSAFRELMFDPDLSVSHRLGALEAIARIEDATLAVEVADDLRRKYLPRDVAADEAAARGFHDAFSGGELNLEVLCRPGKTAARLEEWARLADVYLSAKLIERVRALALQDEKHLRARALRILPGDELIAIAQSGGAPIEDCIEAARDRFRRSDAEKVVLEACLRAAHHAEPKSIDRLLALADLVLDDSERSVEAAALTDQALALDPSNAEALTLLGRIRYGESNYEAALANFEAALRSNPNELFAGYLHGVTLDELEREREAIEAYSQAIALGSTDERCRLFRARCYAWLGYPTEALADLAEVDTDSFNDYRWRVFWRAKVRALVALGRYREALEAIEAMREQSVDLSIISWANALATLMVQGPEAARAVAVACYDSEDSSFKMLMGLFARAEQKPIETVPHLNPEEVAKLDHFDKVWFGLLWNFPFDLVPLGDGELRRLRFNIPYLRLGIGEAAADSFEAQIKAALSKVGDRPPPPRVVGPITAAEPPTAAVPITPPAPPARKRLPPGRYILCRLQALENFESEKDFAAAILRESGTQAAIVFWTLEDGQHIYLQATYRDIPSAPFPFKTVARFDDIVSHRLLQDLVLPAPGPVELIVVDDALAKKFATTPALQTLAKSVRRPSSAAKPVSPTAPESSQTGARVQTGTWTQPKVSIRINPLR